jgi:hypothetical protein
MENESRQAKLLELLNISLNTKLEYLSEQHKSQKANIRSLKFSWFEMNKDINELLHWDDLHRHSLEETSRHVDESHRGSKDDRPKTPLKTTRTPANEKTPVKDTPKHTQADKRQPDSATKRERPGDNERSRTPVPTKKDPVPRFTKEEKKQIPKKDNDLSKSTNNLAQVQQQSKVETRKGTVIKAADDKDKKASFIKVDKGDTTPRQTKRDMTPTPTKKHSMIDDTKKNTTIIRKRGSTKEGTSTPLGLEKNDGKKDDIPVVENKITQHLEIKKKEIILPPMYKADENKEKKFLKILSCSKILSLKLRYMLMTNYKGIFDQGINILVKDRIQQLDQEMKNIENKLQPYLNVRKIIYINRILKMKPC